MHVLKRDVDVEPGLVFLRESLLRRRVLPDELYSLAGEELLVVLYCRINRPLYQLAWRLKVGF